MLLRTKMRVLDLFSGTGSVAKVCDELNWEVFSIDKSDRYHKPELMIDILDWDYRVYSIGHFDIVFAGVPCTEYSVLNYCNPNKTPDIESANRLVMRTLEIIHYFKPKYWFIENPDTSSLKKQPFMSSIPYYVVSYCMYGFPYQKNTRIWTNLENFEPKKCKRNCEYMRGNSHINSLGNNKPNKISNLRIKYAYPPKLLISLFDTVRQNLDASDLNLS